MSTAVVPANQLPAPWSAEQERIIKEQVAGGMNPPITNAEFAYFAEVCRTRRLSPIAGQIVPVRRGGKMIIQTTIHGLRAMADETGDYAPGAATRYITTGDDKLFSAVAFVLKYAHGAWHEVAETAHWDEYKDDRSPIWKDKPRLMLAKCAEALALRRAFPAKLGGIYTDDELGPEREPAPPASAADRARLLRAATAVEFSTEACRDELLRRSGQPRTATVPASIYQALAKDLEDVASGDAELRFDPAGAPVFQRGAPATV